MPEPTQPVSNPDALILQTEAESGVGIPLTEVSETTIPGIVVHEVGWSRLKNPWNFTDVVSPFWRLYHNPEKGSHVEVDGRKIPIDPRQIVVIPAHRKFNCRGPRMTDHFWIHFTLTPTYGFRREEPFSIPLDAVLKSLLQEVMTLHDQPRRTGYRRRVCHAAAALLHTTFARHPLQVQPPLPAPLKNVLQIIAHSPAADLSNPFLSRQAGMSVEGFIRWFKDHMHTTPAQHVLRTRLGHACRLLAYTDQTIDQIAADCGFPNRHYFTRVFTREFHTGPATFRKKHQQAA